MRIDANELIVNVTARQHLLAITSCICRTERRAWEKRSAPT
ncbi:hypothetical protein SynMINOS11_01058 [Synechococcus sp. Minos11]|nr:hypothetical protein SynMINOS11_01058 [Synechococcus sp. Minos11]